MIVELRSLLSASEEEERSQRSGENGSGVKQEAAEPPVVEVDIRSAGPPRASSSLSAGSPVPENFLPPASEGYGGAFRDDRIPELLERLLAAAERNAAFSERIADLMERQSSEPAPVYA